MTAPSRGRTRRRFPLPTRVGRSRTRYLGAALLTALLAVLALPDLLLGLDRHSPFAQLVSFRPWVLVGVLTLLALLTLTLRFERRAWPFAAGALVVLLVGASMVLPRTVADPPPTSGTPFSVLAFNTYEGAADVEELADLIHAERPDVVALVEAGERYRSLLAPLVEPLGYRLHTSTPPGSPDVQGITALVAPGMGTVRARIGADTSAFPYIEVTAGALGALSFVAFHSVAPVPGAVPLWRSDLELLERWCAGSTPAVIAGDFNATLDHSALREGTAGCADAADQRGRGLVPTWGPTQGTRAIGPQIDHVIVTGGIAAETFAVHDIGGSDHRAVLTRLRLGG